MNALEQEIIDRVRQLDAAHQRRVLEFLRGIESAPLSDAEWLEQARALREQLRAKYGDDFQVDSQTLLDEAREERLDDLMGSR